MNEYEVKEIKLTEIYNDNSFNCRGTIMPFDVVDLAKDIEKSGLQFPIAVQPYDKDGYKYRIVAGHRRFVAFRVLKLKTIPVMIKSGLSELQARLINLGENLKRKDLNILQEAGAISKLREYGMTQEAISAELGMSRTWVQIRLHLLHLPEDIQAEAAAGMLNQYQIRQIFSLDTKEKQYEAVRQIKNARLCGERNIDVGKKAKEDPFKKKRQTKTAVQDMINHIAETVGFGLHTRTLAWANGEINSAELFYDIKRYADDNNMDNFVAFILTIVLVVVCTAILSLQISTLTERVEALGSAVKISIGGW